MDNPDTIIKELRVDWETVLTDEFNPLHLSLAISRSSSLASDFRDMYHKLESSMEKIISVNFKGFSDSVLSYNKFNSNNKKLLNHLNKIENSSRAIKQSKFDIKNLSKENENRNHHKIKYDICKNLREAKTIYDKITSEEVDDPLKNKGIDNDILYKSNQIVKCLNLLDDINFAKIKGVDEYRKQVYKEYLKIISDVNDRMLEYIFDNKIENIFFFKCILVLGGLEVLEKYLRENFKNMVFAQFEKAINSAYIYFDESSVSLLKATCLRIVKKAESISCNMETIIRRSNSFFKLNNTQIDFFGNEEDAFIYLVDEKRMISDLQDVLQEFIRAYSTEEEPGKGKFDLENVIDDIDYTQIPCTANEEVEDDSNIRINDKNFNKKSGFTVITTPKHECINYMIEAQSGFRNFFIALKEKEFDRDRLDACKSKIDSIFEIEAPKSKEIQGESKVDSGFSLDYSKKRLNLKLDEYIGISSSLNNYITDKAVVFFTQLHQKLFRSEIISKTNNMIELRDTLMRKYISKIDLLDGRHFVATAIFAFNTIGDLKEAIRSNQLNELYILYSESLKKQIHLEFFYYFDLLYRQGNYHYYIKTLVKKMKLIYEESRGCRENVFDDLYESVEYYCKRNTNVMVVKSKKDLEEFIEQLRILDEILGEIEFENNLENLYKFFEDVINEQPREEFGKKLMGRISNKDNA